MLEFSRDLGEEGYFQFHSEQKQAIQALDQKFGIALNKRVRLRLHGWDEAFEGKLMLASLLVPSIDAATIPFDRTDIESCNII